MSKTKTVTSPKAPTIKYYVTLLQDKLLGLVVLDVALLQGRRGSTRQIVDRGLRHQHVHTVHLHRLFVGPVHVHRGQEVGSFSQPRVPFLHPLPPELRGGVGECWGSLILGSTVPTTLRAGPWEKKTVWFTHTPTLTHTHTHTHTHTQTDTHTHTHTHIHTHTHTRTYTQTHTHTRTQTLYRLLGRRTVLLS